jgi:hypothetical protein
MQIPQDYVFRCSSQEIGLFFFTGFFFGMEDRGPVEHAENVTTEKESNFHFDCTSGEKKKYLYLC